MGYPSFIKYLKQQIPSLNSAAQKPEFQIDNMYVDLDFMLYKVVNNFKISESLPNAQETKEIIEQVQTMLVDCVKLFKPSTFLFIALEGSQPRAKLNYTRQHNNLNEQDQLFDIKHKKAALEALKKQEEEEKEIDEEVLNMANQKQTVDFLSCGTQFIRDVADALKDFIALQMESEWNSLKIVFSDDSVPGENKQKIFEFIKSQKKAENYNNNAQNLILSNNSDMVMHGVPLIDIPIFVAQNPADLESVISVAEVQNYFVEQFITGNNVESDEQKKYIEENNVKERVLYDLVLIFLFIGTEYLPSLPSLENKLRSTYVIIDTYKKYIQKQKFQPITTKDFYVSLIKLQIFIYVLSQNEQQSVQSERKKLQETQTAEYTQLKEKVDKIAAVDKATLSQMQKFNHELDILYLEQPKKPFGMTAEKFLYEEKDFAKQYYETKFPHLKSIDQSFIQTICQNYIEGLLWNFEYIVRGCISNNWFYKFHYTPFPSDIQQSFLQFQFPNFTKGIQQTPLVNLVSCISGQAKKDVLSAGLAKLIEKSDLSQYYPTSFNIDSVGKYYFKQSVLSNLPFVDADAVKQTLKTNEKELSEQEKSRNTISKNPRFFVCGDKQGKEPIFEINDYSVLSVVGIFQRVNEEGSKVNMFKLKYTTATPENLFKNLKENDLVQQQQENIQKQKHIQHKKEVEENKAKQQCKFGATCKNLKLNKCPFYHTEEEIANKDRPAPCMLGQKCKYFKQGTCKYYHE